MSLTRDRLREYLPAGEPLRGVYPATLSDESARTEVTVGVTDRRLLCVSDDGTLLSVGYDSICAIRSRPRSKLTYQGNDYGLMLGGGALLSVLGILGLVVFTGSAVIPVLITTTVGGIAATGSLYWHDGRGELVTLADVEQRVAADVDVAAIRQLDREVPVEVELETVLLSLTLLVTFLSFAGALTVASTPAVVLFGLPVVGGFALLEYARRHADELDGIEISRDWARNVRITTDDGRTIQMEIDQSSDIDRELSRLAFVDTNETVASLSHRC